MLDLVGWECLNNDVSAVDGAWFGILGFGAADFRFRVAPFFLLGHLPWWPTRSTAGPSRACPEHHDHCFEKVAEPSVVSFVPSHVQNCPLFFLFVH